MRFALAAACLALVTAAHADPATPEGAKKIADGYAAFLSPGAIEKGVVSVKPEGEDYIVTYDFEKALAALDASAKVIEMAPFSYRLTPTVNGGWLARANALPTLKLAPGGAEGGTIAFDGFRFDGLYDPAASDVFIGKLALPSLRLDIKAKSNEQMQHILLTQEGSAGDLRIRAGADPESIDLRSTQAATGSTQTTAIMGENGGETAFSEMKQGAATGDGGVIGLRAKAFADLWRYVVAHPNGPGPQPEAIKPLLAALGPLWRELSGRIEVNDIAVAFPGGSLSFKSVSEDLRMTGLAEHASMSLAVALREVSANVAGAPDWAKGIWPASLGLKIEGGVDDLDKAARMALDDPEFLKSGNLSENTRVAIAALMVAGRPHVKLSATRLSTPLGVATVEGEANFAGQASARGRITADSLDKLMETLAKLTETEPDAQNYLYLATFVRGLARAEDGKLIWDVEYVAPDSIKVNGQVFPPAETDKAGKSDKPDDDEDEDGDGK